MANANESLKDELEQERREKEWAETWKPQAAGDMLIGTLQGYDEAETDFGSYTVAHIRDEEGVLRGLWLMHSVLQDEWSEADPGRGERVGVQYLGKRSGENYDYHMWTVKVDRPEAAGNESGAERDSDRPPQESRSEAESGVPEFEGDKLYGEPAVERSANTDAAEREPNGDAGGESTLDDPNGSLPF
ncbi:hypothetical protein [Salinibacter altiplanensis]|uniref:hypothetical protein n=1 Tax=Salinibacter altiplanensis TaxID=1803181 RepID=UPI000C9FAFF8|nr:hypothetical protein [Salinibacter altiplanensis]